MSRLVLGTCFKLKMIFGTCFRKLCRKMKTIDEFLRELINEQLEQGIFKGLRETEEKRTFLGENTACSDKGSR